MTKAGKVAVKKAVVVMSLVFLAGCSGGSDDGEQVNYTSLACDNTPADSQQIAGGIERIHSEFVSNQYKQLETRSGIFVDYMVHAAQGTPRALLVLITGGQLDAAIVGSTGLAAYSAGGGFLVRSAHLFAARGYKVVTMDRPDDWLVYLDQDHPNQSAGSAFDSYRLSAEHATDLANVIAAENSNALPVVIAGNGRGAISAVAQHELADYLLLSAPVTTGNYGTPIGDAGVQPASVSEKPVHIIWHRQDACQTSPPSGGNRIAGQFANATAVAVSGGYNDPEDLEVDYNAYCRGARTFHGFVGIESCVVKNASDWLDEQLAP